MSIKKEKKQSLGREILSSVKEAKLKGLITLSPKIIPTNQINKTNNIITKAEAAIKPSQPAFNYVKSIPISARNELDIYFSSKDKLKHWQFKYIKSLVENYQMNEVYASFKKCKINNEFLSNILIENKVGQITKASTFHYDLNILFIQTCISILQFTQNFKPLAFSKYKKKLKKLSNLCSKAANLIEEFETSGIYRLSWLYQKNVERLRSISTDSLTASSKKTIFTPGVHLTQKTKEFKHQFFIYKLIEYMKLMFNQPHYNIVAITTNVIFSLDNRFDSTSIRKYYEGRF